MIERWRIWLNPLSPCLSVTWFMDAPLRNLLSSMLAPIILLVISQSRSLAHIQVYTHTILWHTNVHPDYTHIQFCGTHTHIYTPTIYMYKYSRTVQSATIYHITTRYHTHNNSRNQRQTRKHSIEKTFSVDTVKPW